MRNGLVKVTLRNLLSCKAEWCGAIFCLMASQEHCILLFGSQPSLLFLSFGFGDSCASALLEQSFTLPRRCPSLRVKTRLETEASHDYASRHMEAC